MRMKYSSFRWLCWNVPEPCAPGKQWRLRNPPPSSCVQSSKRILPFLTSRLRPVPRHPQNSSVYQLHCFFFFFEMLLILINALSIAIACKNHPLNWPVHYVFYKGVVTSGEGRDWDKEDRCIFSCNGKHKNLKCGKKLTFSSFVQRYLLFHVPSCLKCFKINF